jgi:2-dehydro-3-deoxyphosphogluconate aldolase/(4S)-4-hydroxy-2-oxoglutarate aldolase
VVAVGDVKEALALAGAFAEAGVKLVEIVLRLPGAMECIAAVGEAFPDLVVGAGTITRGEELEALERAGGRFAVSPGATPELLEAMGDSKLACLPGIATVSEALRVRDSGLGAVKVFPASVLGGPAFLRAVAPVLEGLHFCPTGGVGPDTLADYLACPRVFAFGASWPCKRDLIESGDWQEVTRRCRVLIEAAKAVSPS